jgi:hypothetical protein
VILITSTYPTDWPVSLSRFPPTSRYATRWGCSLGGVSRSDRWPRGCRSPGRSRR